MSKAFWNAFLIGYIRANVWLSPAWIAMIAYLIWKNT
jgi:hypothetical protein